MAKSMLVYQAVPVDPNGAATLVGLHGRGGNAEELVSLARELGVYQLIAPQAAHSLNPVTQQTSADGFAWYFIQEIGYPEPATFGEGLWLLEQFIYDVRERQGSDLPIVLVGYDQGAVLAATLAAVLPDELIGVAAICGYLPEIRGWSPPVERIGGLPVLLVRDPGDTEIPRDLIDRTAIELGRRGAAVELQDIEGARSNLLLTAGTLRNWLTYTFESRQLAAGAGLIP